MVPLQQAGVVLLQVFPEAVQEGTSHASAGNDPVVVQV
jgi:hypothetical protein